MSSIQFELPSGKVVANHTFGPKTTLENVHMWIRSKIQDTCLYQVYLFDDHDFSKPLLPCSKQLTKDVKTISIVKKFHPHVQALKEELEKDPACITNYAENGDVEAMNVLLSLKADPNIRRNHGWTPLHWASSNGHVEATKLLVQTKTNLNARTDSHSTPLHIATRYGNVNMVRHLLQINANPTLLDKRGYTPLRIASNAGRDESVAILKQATKIWKTWKD
jgi:hypothetical protein